MSEPENFLSRWSRRKLEVEQAETTADRVEVADPVLVETAPGSMPAEPAAAMPEEPPFDPATLPPIDSIGAATDIRDFLRSGVPAELTRAALRRVWTSDPAIRDFIGIAENQWDFATAKDLPGFGPLESSEELTEIANRIMTEGRPVVRIEAPAADEDVVAVDDLNAVPNSTSHMEPLHEAEQGVDEAAGHQDCQLAELPSDTSGEFAALQKAGREGDDEKLPVRRAHGRALPQ